MVVDPWTKTQPIRSGRSSYKACQLGGCLPLLLVACFVLTSAVYIFAPTRTNVLLLGIDRSPEGTTLGRSDTIILATIVPLKPYVGMLSIPRDLWVTVPGVGENRINTAHFFAENERRGSGPQAAMETVRQNFGIDVRYYVRLHFDSFQRFIDALSGLEINLESPTSGYPPGKHLLNGEQALAFVRDRQGGDDFFRMQHGQLVLKALARQILSPRYWMRVPTAAMVFFESVDTNLPPWQWPRVGLAILRAGRGEIDSRVISREMVHPFTTNGGAQVLAPDWSKINPVLLEMFE